MNEPVLAATTVHLREAMGMPNYATLPMDWSRRNGSLVADLPPSSVGQHLDFPNAFVVVHGAGLTQCLLLKLCFLNSPFLGCICSVLLVGYHHLDDMVSQFIQCLLLSLFWNA